MGDRHVMIEGTEYAVKKVPREKMSKSKGNGISVDEFLGYAHTILSGFEFRFRSSNVCDHNKVNVYKCPETGMFFTFHCHGHLPVFLCVIGDPIPPAFPYGIQHENDEFWDRPWNEYENGWKPGYPHAPGTIATCPASGE